MKEKGVPPSPGRSWSMSPLFYHFATICFTIFGNTLPFLVAWKCLVMSPSIQES